MRSLRARSAALTLLVTAGLIAVGSDANAQQLRYSTTQPGGIAATGNTLGLAKAFNANGPGTQDSIGTFLSLDANSFDDSPVNAGNPWPGNTTWDWTQNGSASSLELPTGAQVLYAELVWAGSYNYLENVSAFLNDPVVLGFGPDVMSANPSVLTAQTFAETAFSGFAANYYIRSAEVTTFVQSHGAGVYDVSGVPATQTDTINSLNAAGWTLVVAFRGEDQPIRNLSVFVGGSFVDEDSQQDYTVSGFCAPPFGPVEGNVVVSALEGDADLTGDILQLAQTDVGPFITLDGPNNPSDNFFSSQVNDDNGNLDTTGTFGNVNHDPFLGINVAGGRQGWDLTTLPLSSNLGHLDNNQTSAVVRTVTTGDSFVPTLVALELDVKAPDFQNSSTDASVEVVQEGDQFTLTATLANMGEAQANDLRFVMDVPAGLNMLGYSTNGMTGDASGFPVTPSNVADGVDAGVLPVGESISVELTLETVGPPDNGATFIFAPTWDHDFITCDGDDAIEESFSPPTETVQYMAMVPEGTGGMGGAGGMSGTGGNTGGGGVVPPGDDDGNVIEEDGGCGCAVPGNDDDDPTAPLLAFAALGLVAARRRRS
jgi:MYXO-CTERM domain-containing protein